MSATHRFSRMAAGVIAACVLALTASAGSAAVRPGDILVGDIDPMTGDGAIIKVSPATGKQTLLSSNSTAANVGTSEFLDDPYGLSVTRSGTILAAEEYAGDPMGSGSLIAINSSTGKQALLTTNAMSPPGLLVDPNDAEFVPGLGLLVTDRSSTTTGGVVKVGAGGAQSLFSANSQPVNMGSSELMIDPTDLATTPAGTLIVTSSNGARLIRLDRRTGKQHVFSSNAQPVNAASMHFVIPSGVAAEPGGPVFVADSVAFTDGGVIAVDPATGKQTLFSSNSQQINLGVSEHFAAPLRIARLLDGDLVVVQDNVDAPVVRVKRDTGQQTILSSNAQDLNSSSMFFDTPYAITVVPPRCLGQYAPLYGTPGADTFTATPFSDVASGLGGGDRIAGAGGSDRICGDAGSDRLSGGNRADRVSGGSGADRLAGGRGRDRLTGGGGLDSLRGGPGGDVLRGGPGRDVLVGGPGRDICIGGPGRDRTRGCETTRR